MFGYIVADKNGLTADQLERYRSWYCGLCRALRVRSGQFSRLTLNYDMTFLIMLLSSLYEPEHSGGWERCGIHPVHRHCFFYNRYTEYAADMNLALAYHNCLDDYADEGSFLKLGYAKLLQARYNILLEQYPRQCGAMEQQLRLLKEAETSGEYAPDRAANSFGALMGELFVFDPEDFWAPALRRTGETLGRFIYMLDACVDLEKDKRRGRYNPLLRPDGSHMERGEMAELLTVLIGECVREFARLPLVQDVEILENILFTGVWQRFNNQGKTDREQVNDDQ